MMNKEQRTRAAEVTKREVVEKWPRNLVLTVLAALAGGGASLPGEGAHSKELADLQRQIDNHIRQSERQADRAEANLQRLRQDFRMALIAGNSSFLSFSPLTEEPPVLMMEAPEDETEEPEGD